MWSCEENSQSIFPGFVGKLIKYWPGGYHLVMKSTPRVTGDRPRMDIYTEGSGNTVPGVPYLSCYPDDYPNISIRSVLCPHLLGI